MTIVEKVLSLIVWQTKNTMVQTNNTQKKAEKSFVREWSGKGYEKGSDVVARLFKMYQELTQK